jgi:hypothetical protein
VHQWSNDQLRQRSTVVQSDRQKSESVCKVRTHRTVWCATELSGAPVDLSLGEDDALVEDRDVVIYEDVDFNTQPRTMECVDAGIHATHEGDHTAQVSSCSLFDHFFVI